MARPEYGHETCREPSRTVQAPHAESRAPDEVHAGELVCQGRHGFRGRGTDGRRHREQCPAPGQLGRAPPVGEEAEVPDPHETTREHMDQEPAEEPRGRKSHRFHAGSVREESYRVSQGGSDSSPVVIPRNPTSRISFPRDRRRRQTLARSRLGRGLLLPPFAPLAIVAWRSRANPRWIGATVMAATAPRSGAAASDCLSSIYTAPRPISPAGADTSEPGLFTKDP